MANVLLLILLIISIIMTGLILIQRSEGGALGIGGGGGGGGFMSGRSAANSISRMTGILGALFLICSLALSIVFNRANEQTSILDETTAESPLTSPIDSAEDTDPLASLSEDTVTETEIPAETPSETEPTPSDDEPEAPEATGDE